MNKKTILIILGISVGLLLSISILIGFAGSSIIGSFWSWFWLSLLAQIVIFSVANSYLLQRDTEILQQQELEALDKISKFTVRLYCSYCQQQNLIPLILDKRNTFKCDGCNQVNGVSMQFMATSLTSPLQSVKLPTTLDSGETSGAEIKVVS